MNKNKASYKQIAIASVLTVSAALNLPNLQPSIWSEVQPANAILDDAATGLAVAGHHACAILSNGTVKCWGAGGKLGNGNESTSTTPVAVSNLSNVKQLAAGENHTCAIADAGVFCWGGNTFGQIGNGGTAQALTPVNIPEAAGGLQMAGGYGHTCLVTATRTLKCWGRNENGEAGHPSQKTPILRPTDVPNISNVKQVITGIRFTCVLTQAGKVQCWGRQYPNDPENIFRPTPVEVGNLSEGVSAISGNGEHICALLQNGKVKCWGINNSGELGNGSTTSSATPVEVTGLTNVTSIAAGRYHTCAIVNNGGVRCWGLNSQGQLGTGGYANSNTPAIVAGLGGSASVIGAGPFYATSRSNNTTIYYGNFTCALLTNQTIQCWGNNFDGQLGNGTKTGSPIPKFVSTFNQSSATATPTSNAPTSTPIVAAPTATPDIPFVTARKQFMPLSLNRRNADLLQGPEREPNHAKNAAVDGLERKRIRRAGYVFANGPLSYDDIHEALTAETTIFRDGVEEVDDADWFYFDVLPSSPSVVIIMGGPVVEEWTGAQLQVYYQRAAPVPSTPGSFEDDCYVEGTPIESFDRTRFFASACGIARVFGETQPAFTPYVIGIDNPQPGRYYVMAFTAENRRKESSWKYHLKIVETQ